MTDKPIIFSTEMVRAILDGRKTQTRRVVLPQPDNSMRIIGPKWFEPTVTDKHGEEVPGDPIYGIYADMDDWGLKAFHQPGDILWVRETWTYLADGPLPIIPMVGYRSDMSTRVIDNIPDGKIVYNAEKPDVWKWKPSIHMLRKAARIFLEVKNVRVERVQDIKRSELFLEGCPQEIGAPDGDIRAAYLWFRNLWDSLNAKRGYGWKQNPWVWVYDFERVEGE